MAAGALVYALVPNPLGASSWGERQIEAVRMGGHDRPREQLGSHASRVILALQAPATDFYVLPAGAASRERDPDPPSIAADSRMLGAFEAIGLRPEDLQEKADTPASAVSLADAVTDALDWGFEGASRLRALVRESGAPPLRIEEHPRFEKPDYVKFQPPQAAQSPMPLIFAKKVVRSVYKVLLGVAIGILIWGMVRRSANKGGEGEPGPFFR